MEAANLVSVDTGKTFIHTRAEWEHALRAAPNPGAVFEIAQDFGIDPQLKNFDYRALVQLAAKLMGTTYSTLLRDLKAEANAEPKKHHRDYARETLALFGDGNLVYSQSGFYAWRDSGVWAPILDHEVRRAAADCLEGQEAITDGLVRSVLALARDEAYIESTRFDVPADRRINTMNGTLEYKGGAWVLREHCREDFLTVQVPVSYDEQAACPRFDLFLAEIFEGDADGKEKAQVVLEMMGYSLLQSARYHKFIILLGGGSNGKSVLLSVLENLIGRNQCAAINPAELTGKFTRAHLRGKLANIVPELPVGTILADDHVKSFTSGDSVNAEFKGQDAFNFTPFATFWMGTNHLPFTRDLSFGMFRRAIILNLNRKFGEAEADVQLIDKLLAELPGILARVVRAFAGVIERGGFTVPDSSAEALKAWRRDSDQVAQFVDEMCEVKAGHGPVTHAELFNTFKEWTQDQNIRHSVSGKAFTARLEALGLTSERFTLGKVTARGFYGIELNSRL